jgi:hypothetical protein
MAQITITKRPPVGTGEDVLRGAGAGLRKGVESIAGTPQDMATLAAIGSAWLAGKLGAKLQGLGRNPAAAQQRGGP